MPPVSQPPTERPFAALSARLDRRVEYFDADGAPIPPTAAHAMGLRPFPVARLGGSRCTRATLSGGWLMHLEPCWPHLATAIRGPLRIEADGAAMRASADIYVRRGRTPIEPIGSPITALPFVIERNWYPHLPQAEYAFYLRSTGIAYAGDQLTIQVQRLIWDRSIGTFGAEDSGSITLRCGWDLLHHPRLPRPTVRLTGHARIGGRDYRVVATKTATWMRAFNVAVDVLGGDEAAWPARAQVEADVQARLRAVGLDARVTRDAIPGLDGQTPEQIARLVEAQRAAIGTAWQLRLLAGARAQLRAGSSLIPLDSATEDVGAVALAGLHAHLRAAGPVLHRRVAMSVGAPDPTGLAHAPDPHVAPGWPRARAARRMPSAAPASLPATRLERPRAEATPRCVVRTGHARRALRPL